MGPGFLGSGFRVQLPVLEAAKKKSMNRTWHGRKKRGRKREFALIWETMQLYKLVNILSKWQVKS